MELDMYRSFFFALFRHRKVSLCHLYIYIVFIVTLDLRCIMQRVTLQELCLYIYIFFQVIIIVYYNPMQRVTLQELCLYIYIFFQVIIIVLYIWILIRFLVKDFLVEFVCNYQVIIESIVSVTVEIFPVFAVDCIWKTKKSFQSPLKHISTAVPHHRRVQIGTSERTLMYILTGELGQ